MIKLSDIAYIETKKTILKYFENCKEELPSKMIFVPQNYSVSFRGIKIVDVMFINEYQDGYYLITKKTTSTMSKYSISFMLNSIPCVHTLLYDTNNLVFRKITKRRLQKCLLKEINKEIEPSIIFIQQIIEKSLAQGKENMSDFDMSMYNLWTDLMDAIALEMYILDRFDKDTSVTLAWAQLFNEKKNEDNPIRVMTNCLLSTNNEVMNRKKRLHVIMSRIGELLRN